MRDVVCECLFLQMSNALSSDDYASKVMPLLRSTWNGVAVSDDSSSPIATLVAEESGPFAYKMQNDLKKEDCEVLVRVSAQIHARNESNRPPARPT